MNAQLQRVAEMIKKTLKPEAVPCFEGCVLYINEHCIAVRSSCMADMSNKFNVIEKKLDKIISIVGTNGDK